MTISSSHRLQKVRKREFGGEATARGLIQWLNARTGKQDSKRIIEIIEASHALHQHRSRAERGIGGAKWEGKWGRALRNLLASGLGRYLFQPVYCGDSGGRWVVQWTPLGVNRKSVPVVTYPTQITVPWGEGSAIKALIELGCQGYVNRIRQCLCSKWLYALFDHQRNCSRTCQQKLFSQSVEYKRKRRQYMRDYRQREKALDERTKRSIRI